MPNILLCPFCYREFDSESVDWRCSGPTCRSLRSAVDERLKAYVQEINPGAALPNMGPSFPTQTKRTPTQILKGERLIQKCPAPDCRRESLQSLCPLCHNNLPFSLESSDSRIIAIVGAKETSKSHYIAALDKELMELGRAYDFSIMRVDDHTREVLKTMQKRIYRDRKKLDETQIGLEQPRPLMFRLKFGGKNAFSSSRSLMLVFFDAAGEIFDSQEKMGVRSRYLDRAAAILLLIDPLQIPSLNDELQNRGVSMPSLEHTSPGEILERLIELKELNRTSTRQRKIEQPLALAFTKIDALRDFGKLRPNDPLYNLPTHQFRFDPNVQKTINDYLKSFYDEHDRFTSGAISQGLEKSFKTYSYFGVSALGVAPDANGNVHNVNPFRVEDPLLWILKQLGYIP